MDGSQLDSKKSFPTNQVGNETKGQRTVENVISVFIKNNKKKQNRWTLFFYQKVNMILHKK